MTKLNNFNAKVAKLTNSFDLQWNSNQNTEKSRVSCQIPMNLRSKTNKPVQKCQNPIKNRFRPKSRPKKCPEKKRENPPFHRPLIFPKNTSQSKMWVSSSAPRVPGTSELKSSRSGKAIKKSPRYFYPIKKSPSYFVKKCTSEVPGPPRTGSDCPAGHSRLFYG